MQRHLVIIEYNDHNNNSRKIKLNLLHNLHYVGFINQHLHQRRISEHKSSNSSIGRHMKKHGVENPNLTDSFSVLKECRKQVQMPCLRAAINTRTQTIIECASDSILSKIFYWIYITMEHARIQPNLFKLQLLKQLKNLTFLTLDNDVWCIKTSNDVFWV